MTALERYAAPRALGEALELLRDGDVTIVAGGTDVMPQSHSGKVKFGRTLLNVRRIPELAGLCSRAHGGSARLPRYRALENAVVRAVAVLAAAADISRASRCATARPSAETSATLRRPATCWCR
jgi:CO/xanthine dehydrogenase FAD-binding subunit